MDINIFLHLLPAVEPCTDFKVCAKLFDGFTVTQLEPLLPPEVTELRHLSFAAGFAAIRLKAEGVASAMQISQTVLRAIDIDNAKDVSDTGATWSQLHRASTWDLRLRLLLWHVFVSRTAEFAQRWAILLPKAELLRDILLERCGFNVRHLPGAVQPPPALTSDLFSKAFQHGVKEGATIFDFRCDLPTFQRRAQFAAPGNVALAAALRGRIYGALSDDQQWIVTEGWGEHDRAFPLPPWSALSGLVVVFMNTAGQVTAVFQAEGVRVAKSRGNKPTRWMDPAISWKSVEGGLKPIPEFDVTSVVRNKRSWEREISKLDAVGRIVVSGQMVYPMKTNDVFRIDRPNLKTCELAEDVIDDLFAEYLIVGALEYCPPGYEPLCICGMGLVVKKTHPFWRLIIDFRQVNEFLAKWPSRMTGLAANANLFSPGAVAWSRDISKGYLANVLDGCQSGLHGGAELDDTPHKRFKTSDQRRFWVGCQPETCSNACSKALMGVRWKGQVYRMACGWFGTKHGGNILDAVMQPLIQEIRERYGVNVLLWVDDILCLCPNVDPTHDLRACGGRGVCEPCTATFVKAEEIERKVDELIATLGLLTNEKNEPCAQVGEFTGLHWDTINMVFFLTEAKAKSLGEKAQALLDNLRVTPREVARFRGKLFWYGPCVPGVRILTRGLNGYIGDMPDDEWDKHKPLDDDARDELEFLAENLPTLAEIARPMKKPAPSDLLQRFVLGHPSVDFVWSNDAAIPGYGAVLQRHVSLGYERVLLSARWRGAPHPHQVHREALGVNGSLDAFIPYIQNSSVLLLADCSPVSRALEVGSKGSKELQRSARYFWRLCLKYNVTVFSYWIQGDTMLWLGTDGLSRDETIDPHDVRVSNSVWQLAQSAAVNSGFKLTTDLFADEHNSKCPLFWSRYPAPGSLGTDSLSSPGWGQTWCKECKAFVSQGLWVFPPIPLVTVTVAKLQRDRAHGILLLPAAEKEPWWPILVDACGKGQLVYDLSEYEVITFHGSSPEHLQKKKMYQRGRWRLCVFDFSQQPSNPFTYSQDCEQHALEHWTSQGLSPAIVRHSNYLLSACGSKEVPLENIDLTVLRVEHLSEGQQLFSIAASDST